MKMVIHKEGLQIEVNGDDEQVLDVIESIIDVYKLEKERSQYNPDYVFHPADTLQECMNERNLSIHALSVQTGLEAHYIHKLLHSVVGISPNAARQFSKVFGPSVGFWIKLQAAYDTRKEGK